MGTELLIHDKTVAQSDFQISGVRQREYRRIEAILSERGKRDLKLWEYERMITSERMRPWRQQTERYTPLIRSPKLKRISFLEKKRIRFWRYESEVSVYTRDVSAEVTRMTMLRGKKSDWQYHKDSSWLFSFIYLGLKSYEEVPFVVAKNMIYKTTLCDHELNKIPWRSGEDSRFWFVDEY